MEPGPVRLQVTAVPAVTFAVKVCEPPIGTVAELGVIPIAETIGGALLLLLPPPHATMAKTTKHKRKNVRIPRIICSIPEGVQRIL
jgi:hypothetical protein